MAEQSFHLPDVGEGLTEAEVLRWLVRAGDLVEVNQMVVEIETAKAAVELPCPFAGTVAALLVEEGSIVPVGTPIITVTTADGAAAPERQAVLVGYGVREQTAPTRRRRSRAADAAALPESPVAEPAVQQGAPASTARPLAKPPVRRLARELGVDLTDVRPTGAHGEVTRADGPRVRRPHPLGEPLLLRRRPPVSRASGSRCAACSAPWPRRWWHRRSPPPM
jgi:2-oxoisovalerate dehydrogenase E2 component (dihydrolipoyl transacylase)